MGKHIILLIAILGVTLLAGCKSEPTSRTYSADPDTTWDAALSVATNLTGAQPLEVDRERGRIATRWTPMSGPWGVPDPVLGQVDVYQGIIDLTPTAQGTKVSVRFDQQTRQREELVSQNASGGSVAFPVDPDASPLQQMFLDELALQLEQPTGQAVFCGLNRLC